MPPNNQPDDRPDNRAGSPFFSVVVPCYNHARFLPETIRSLAAQKFERMEAVIINDGSPDDTDSVARLLVAQKACPNLRYLAQPNMGPAAARNNGIVHTSGDWLLCLDSDDILADGFLAAVAEYLAANNDADIITGAYREFGAKESGWMLTRYDPERFLERGNLLNCAAFRRTLWEKAGGYASDNPWGGEDWHFWVKCLANGARLAAIPVPMLHYRIHERGSRSQTRSERAGRQEYLALHQTMTPEAYPPEKLREAHAALLRLSAVSETAVRKKLAQLPDLALPHFWLGLAHEGRGEFAEAKAEYLAALQREWPGSWQAEERLQGLECLKKPGGKP